MQNINDMPSEPEGTRGLRTTQATVQPADGPIAPDHDCVIDGRMDPRAPQEENGHPLNTSVVAVRRGQRPPLWLRKLQVAITWAAVANRVWTIPAYNGKYRQYPVRNGGGFGIQASGQASALGLGSALFTATGDDTNGAALRRELADTGADLTGVHVLPGLTTSAEVVVCNGHRAILIDQDTPEPSGDQMATTGR